ncbi:MAG: molybdopterin-dependent oxidoreductase, partial [Bacteroidota bacterium]
MPSQLHRRTCNLCEAMCGLVIEHEEKNIISIRGDKDDPFSKGHICPKAVALKDVYEDPDRLRYPMKRTGDQWQRISWEEAISAAVEGIQKVQDQHGANALGFYAGNPNVHNIGSLLYISQLIRAFKTKNRFSATSADQLPHHFASLFMFGHYFLIPVPDVDRTDFMLILGANPLASNGSLMTAPGIDKRLKAIQQRGGQVVVIDPRRTETAAKASEHHFIKPGTDVFLLLAMVQVLFDEDLVTFGESRLAEFTVGVGQIQEAVQDFSPERVAAITGIAAANIRQLARDFAKAPTAVCYGRMGVSTQAYGGLCHWLINTLNILTDNFD